MRKKLGLIFGGPSSENEISIISARSIFENLDVSKFEIFPIFMNHERDFFLIEKKKETLGSFSDFFLKIKSSKEYDLSGFSLKKVFFQKKGFFEDETKLFFELDSVFNIIHGYPGESGEIQGFLDVLEIPFVGSDLKSSCVLMDKEFTNIIAKFHGIDVLKFEIAYIHEVKNFEFYQKKLDGLPFFIKASNAGSSKGVYKIKNQDDFDEALKEVFYFDQKIIIQKGLELPLEIELAAFISNGELKIADSFGMIRPSKKHGFYSYEAKYFDENGAELKISKDDLSYEIQKNLKELTKKLFRIFNCSFGRVDFLFDEESQKIYFNEINTLPGFTNISMFPKLFMSQGLEYQQILSYLIEESLGNHFKNQ